MEMDSCPKCGSTVEVIERSNEFWGGMNCRSVAPDQMDSGIDTVTTKTVQEAIETGCPLPPSIIPNSMGINLCEVEGFMWTRDKYGNLLSLTIQLKHNAPSVAQAV